MTIGERIKKVRKALDLTQQEFADQIGSKRNTIATYEMGRTEPSAAVVSLVCTKFNVSETWLRTGEGGMFVQQSKEDELSDAVNRLLSGETSEFKRRLILVLSKLDVNEWEILEKRLNEIVGMRPAAPAIAPARVDTRTRAEKPVAEWTDAEINAEAEEYRQSLFEEKRRVESGSASSASGETQLA